VALDPFGSGPWCVSNT